ncbi:MAG TPA: hypothetical protein VF849_01385 [Blattabacteriaceae bacterium]
MKLLTLTQARIENESEPKVISVAEIAINIEDIVIIHPVMDRYDCLIKNVTGIKLRQGDGFYIIGSFKETMEVIEQNIVI